MKSPIFLLSIPRSGSTLLQRMLASHVQIATTSEPWILLPLIYSKMPRGQLSQYSHRNSQLAINDLISQLPDKDKDYNEAIRSMSDTIYKKLCKNDESFFLDKTPRYHLIVNEIIDIYPDAKFIFLFRNPLDVYASVMTTWGNNTFKRMYTAIDDLERGNGNLVSAMNKLGDNYIKVNYEEVVSFPDKVLSRIFDYLKIDQSSSQEMISLSGKLGDQIGIEKYKKIDKSSLNNWKNVFTSSYRKKVINTYVNNLENDILLTAGYDKSKLLNEIKNHKVKFHLSIKDRFHRLFYRVAKYLNAHLLFTKVFSWTKKQYLS